MLGLRQRGWEIALAAWADDVVGKPYTWGQTDCLSLAASAILAMTRTALALPPYRSAATAKQQVEVVLDEHGSIGGALLAQGARRIGGASWAQPGDLLVWEPTDEWPFPEVAVVVGHKAIAADEAHGVCVQPLTVVVRDPAVTLYRVGA